MYAVHVVLYLGAFFLALFTFIFLAGSLVHLAGLINDVLRAMSRSRKVNPAVPQPKAAAQPKVPVTASPAEIYVDASAAYARA